ncbi:MAG: phosphoribosylamine--glycine ligase [Planctomycetes bacterium]|nr:phosphoribosylamine--glycine ligase [Planctomycetota bacterium]
MGRPLPCPERGNVLLIGGGGREHALAWKLRQSPRLGTLWLTDAMNAGLSRLGETCPVSMDCSDAFQMQRWCERNDIHLVVVGPEGPLAAGIADILASEHRQVFGPTKAAAQIEADKVFAKNIMLHASIPTAESRVFHDPESARHYVNAHEDPCVVKAAGLAAGKGAIVCDDQEQALAAIDRIMVDREFGEAGDTMIIEEKLPGQEISVLALVDGRTIWLLDPCQDHKQVGEGDVGPNTGGMGAYCPTPFLEPEILTAVQGEIIVPVVDALRRAGLNYRGVLYTGLMLTPAGPKVLEFNCRFGDPECQPIMARLKTDLFEILWATCTGTLDDVLIEFDPRTACCVVMCAEGYPGPYDKGKPITGIEDAEALGDENQQVIVFHSGTRHDNEGQLVTNGGRVLGVTALADDLQAARDLANAACRCIHFDGAFYRRDIGDRVLVTSP